MVATQRRSDGATEARRDLHPQTLADINLGIKWHQMQVELLTKCRDAMVAQMEAAALADDAPAEPLDRLADDLDSAPASSLQSPASSDGDFGDFRYTDLDARGQDELDPYDMAI